MCFWQEKVAYCKLIKWKEAGKVWEAIRNITRRKERTLNFCGTSSHEWVSYFQRNVFCEQCQDFGRNHDITQQKLQKHMKHTTYNTQTSLISFQIEILNIVKCW
jgi:hypothetical protein